MPLQPRRLIADQRVSGGVRFVEAVIGELLHQVEHAAGDVAADAPRFGACLEDAALGGHFIGLFLAHGAAQQVGAAQGVAGHALRHLHDLLLVHEDAVGGRQHRLHLGVQIFNRRVAALPRAVFGNQVHGAGSVQGHQRHDVFEAVGLEVTRGLLHARRFHLEHRRSLAAGVKGVGLGVVNGNVEDIEGRSAAGDGLHRLLDHREGFQAQKIELDQPDGFQVLHVELGAQPATAGFAVERAIGGQRLGRNHHAAGVHADAAGHALQRQRQVEHHADLFILRVGLLELRHLVHGVGQGGAGGAGDQFGQPVAKAIAVAEHAADVPHHAARGHGGVGDDLPDPVAPVTLGHVLDDAVAVVHAEVDVEVGHRHAFGIEEALEQQIERQRIKVGDADGIGHQRAGARATAGPHRAAVFLGPLNEVGDHQKVSGEAHLFDDAQLVVQALAVLVGAALRQSVGEPLGQTLLGAGTQVGVRRAAVRHRKFGQVIGAERQGQGAAPRDVHAVFQRLGHIGEALGHFFRRLEVLLRRVGARSLGIGQHPPFGNADARLVRLEVVAGEKAHVVGGHHRHAAQLRQGDGLLHPVFIPRPVAAADVQIQPVTEQGLEFVEGGQRRADLIGGGRAEECTVAAGERDQALMMRLQSCPRHAGTSAGLAVDVGGREHRRQVAKTGVVLHQHGEARRRIGRQFRGDPQITADHRLDAHRLGALVKLDRGVDVGRVGDRNRHKPQRRRAGQQGVALPATLALGWLDTHRAVGQGVLGVQPQMDETGHAAHAARARWQGAKLMR